MRLKDYGAEVINMGAYISHEPTFWRFLAMIDPEVDIALSRDADSRFTKCELLMVNEWLASGKKFHVMRPGPYPLPILGGLWGVRGNIPNFKELLEDHLRSGSKFRITDEHFLRDKLYPQMKGKVFVHEHRSRVKPWYFVGETMQPFPAIALNIRGRYLNAIGFNSMPVGFRFRTRRKFFVFSIYKRTIFSEFFLTLLLRIVEKKSTFNGKKIWFYVADNISPSLIERLRSHGRVILKPAKTVRKDDPQYWKLLILSEKNIEQAVIVDFWQFFFLARASKRRISSSMNLLPIERGLPTGIRSGFTRISTLSIYGPAPPVSDIENLIARRDPNENYREFIRSTVYPRTSSTRMMSILMIRGRTGFTWGLVRILLPWLYEFARYLRKYIS